MTTPTLDARHVRGELRRARDVKPGWWVRFAGTYDPDTDTADLTPYWLEVASVEVLPMVERDDACRRRHITFTDGTAGAWPAMHDMEALTAKQARDAGLAPSQTAGAR